MSKRPAHAATTTNNSCTTTAGSSSTTTTTDHKTMAKARKVSHKKERATSATMDDGKEPKNTKEIFTFFYKKDSPFSQFHSCQFTKDDITYNCAEQYMMHQKAVVFGDTEMARSILASSSPPEQKSFGRKVQGFDVKVWKQKCRQIVFDGNYLKFTQNEALLSAMMATDGTTLVEASPRDKIWGIGMGANNPLALNRSTWKGTNYLGEALTQVRERIKSESS